MKNKNNKVRVSSETKNFVGSILLAMFITYVLTFIDIWQLIIIPGLVAGTINKTVRRGIYSGALGVSFIWIIFMIYFIITQNAYINLDQFAGLIFGRLGYGWVIFILILLSGLLFGALGGAIGGYISVLIKLRLERKELELSKSEKLS